MIYVYIVVIAIVALITRHVLQIRREERFWRRQRDLPSAPLEQRSLDFVPESHVIVHVPSERTITSTAIYDDYATYLRQCTREGIVPMSLGLFIDLRKQEAQ